jgi:hypothetical protein
MQRAFLYRQAVFLEGASCEDRSFAVAPMPFRYRYGRRSGLPSFLSVVE